MAGAADGEPFRDALDDAENDRFNYFNKHMDSPIKLIWLPYVTTFQKACIGKYMSNTAKRFLAAAPGTMRVIPNCRARNPL
jgi:hypothetical protein